MWVRLCVFRFSLGQSFPFDSKFRNFSSFCQILAGVEKWLSSYFFLITDVPAQVCTQCGEQYISPAVVDSLQSTIHSGKAKKTITLPVYSFPTLAL
jgi:hypothetical protein